MISRLIPDKIDYDHVDCLVPPNCQPVFPPSIPFFICTVAGFRYYDGPRCIRTIRPGDRLHLVREPDNPYDHKAIAVYAPHDGKLGYLPRDLNQIPATHLDNGKMLHAFVNQVNRGAPPWEMLEVTVVLSWIMRDSMAFLSSTGDLSLYDFEGVHNNERGVPGTTNNFKLCLRQSGNCWKKMKTRSGRLDFEKR